MHGKNYICWWKHTLTSGVAYSHRQGDPALRHNMYLLERAPQIFARRRLRICKTQLFVSDAATILRGPRIWNVTPGSDLWQADPVSRCLAKICPEIEATLTSFPPCHQSDSFGPSQRHRSAPLSGWIICRKTRQLAKRPIGPRVTWWGGPVRGKACGGRANQGPGIEGGICAVFAAVQLFIATWLLISARVQVCQHAGERERERGRQPVLITCTHFAKQQHSGEKSNKCSHFAKQHCHHAAIASSEVVTLHNNV